MSLSLGFDARNGENVCVNGNVCVREKVLSKRRETCNVVFYLELSIPRLSSQRRKVELW